MTDENSPLQIDDDDENDEENSDDAEPELGEEPEAIGRPGRRKGRGVTLSMLVSDGILKPGEGNLIMDYLGKKFTADLLGSGKIRWQETKQLFNSPSAWAIYCKKLINPDKKSGCGWASIKYRGKKLDFYKSAWYKKHRPFSLSVRSTDDLEQLSNNNLERRNGSGCVTDNRSRGMVVREEAVVVEDVKDVDDGKRAIVQHGSLGNRCTDHDPNTLVECTAFSTLGKIQPFTITLSANCLILMDFHSHLTSSEVVGYLAGTWDINSHNLAVMQAFPCKCRLGDKENAPMVEEEVRQSIERRGLRLLGWYHSHPAYSAVPTLRDISCQMEYQIKLKGSSDASYTPCLGLICAPYNKDNPSLESSIQAYWVMPPPENKPLEYGKPMLMNYTVSPESFHSQDLGAELKNLYDYYKKAPDMINFSRQWKDDATYLDKLRNSLEKKCSMDVTDSRITDVVKLLLSSSEKLPKDASGNWKIDSI